MKNYDLFVLAEQLANNIDRLKALKGAKFTYGILKNIEVLEKEVKMIMETSKPSDDFLAYDKARVALCEEFAKDENGEIRKKENPATPGQFEYDIDVESKEWKDAIVKMKEDYKEVLEAREEQIKQYNELLQADFDVELYKIKLDDVPNDISLELMKIIKPFIKE
jgi:hypothetical protein